MTDLHHSEHEYQWGICAWNPNGWWYLVNTRHPHRLWKDDPRRNRVHQATLWRTRKEAREALKIANEAARRYHERTAQGPNESAARHSQGWLDGTNRTKWTVCKVYVRASLYPLEREGGG